MTNARTAALLFMLGITATLVLSCRSSGSRIETSHDSFIIARHDAASPELLIDRNKSSAGNTPNFSTFDLSFCGDRLGYLSTDRGESPTVSCEFCDLRDIERHAARSSEHAAKVWALTNDAPFDAGSLYANCIRSVWQRAILLEPSNRNVRLSLARFRVNSSEPLERRLAFNTWDALVDTLIKQDSKGAAATVFASAASIFLTKAIALYQRPDTSLASLTDAEQSSRELSRGGLPLLQLPPAPAKPSARLGQSEGEYAQQLFLRAVELAPDSIRFRKLALVAAAWQYDWRVLDSVAMKFIAANRADSIAWPAHALAHFLKNGYTASAVATFDSMLRVLPRVDSARYDGLTEVLSEADAAWQMDFLPDAKSQLEQRTWAVIDPMWTTPVNEARVSSMARVATGDLRYSIYAPPGIAGSETPAGVLMRRRGLPIPRWSRRANLNPWNNSFFPIAKVGKIPGPEMFYRGWPSYSSTMEIGRYVGLYGNVRWAFYGELMSLSQLAVGGPGGAAGTATTGGVGSGVNRSALTGCDKNIVLPTLLKCARATQAEWIDAPYYRNKDTVDVHLARFRSTSNDSGDVYISARVPTRQFRAAAKEVQNATPTARVAAWIKSPIGVTLAHAEFDRTLKDYKASTWTAQWTFTVLPQAMMHRVEALNAASGAAASGTAVRAAGGINLFTHTGAGISDVLVAKSVTEPTTPVKRWRDLKIEPNGGVVELAQSIAIAWELYEFAPDQNGRVQWSVEFMLKNASGVIVPDFQQLISGSAVARRTVIDSAQPQYRLTRSAAAKPVLVDHVNIRIGNAPTGVYLLEVKVTDLVSKQSFVRNTNVRVLDDEVQERQRPIPVIRIPFPRNDDIPMQVVKPPPDRPSPTGD